MLDFPVEQAHRLITMTTAMKTAAATGCVSPMTYKVVGEMTAAECVAYAKKNRTLTIQLNADGTDHGWSNAFGDYFVVEPAKHHTGTRVILGA